MALIDGRVESWDARSASGGSLVGHVLGTILTLAGGASFSGGGLLCDADGEAAAIAPAPAALKETGGAFSFGISLEMLGTPPNYATEIACSYDAAFSNPYLGYSLSKNDSGNWQLNTNNAGGYLALDSAVAPSTGIQNFLLIVTNTRRALYRNGTLIAESTTTISPPNFQSDAIFGLGDIVGGRNANARIFAAHFWDEDKTDDVAAFAADPDGDSWAYGGGGTPMVAEAALIHVPVRAGW